ncbi:MAG: porin family protein [Chitinophagales bacterium]
MKHWRNNWEKFVGRKLQDAETSPEGHVWELIEQQLNAQDANSTSNTYKIAAALALLLLMATTSMFLFNSPNGEMAQFNPHLTLTSLETPTNIVSVAVQPEKADIKEAIATDLQKKRNTPTITASLNPIEAIPSNEIDYTNGRLNNPTFSPIYNPQAIKESIQPATEYIAAHIESQNNYILGNQNISIENHSLNTVKQEIFGLNTTNLINISNDFVLENEILISNANSPSILFTQEMAHINSLKGSVVPMDNFMDLNNELAYHPMALMSKENVAEVNLTNEEMMLEVVDQESNWLAEATQEFNEWKASVESTKAEEQLKREMDKQIEEELIEEAILDEDDPLTKLQKKQKDLYYANNINKGFHIGLVTGVQNTWVIKSSRNSEVNRDDVQYKFSPGYQVGLNFGYDITNHFGLMAEVKFSDEGTKYYNPAKDRTEHLDLKYIEIPVYVKFKHSKPTAKMKPMVFNYLAGVSFSDLRSVSTTIDNELDQRFAQDYNTSEWGLTAGFDFDIYTNRNLFWTVGTRASVSGLSKSFPKFKGEEAGTLNYSVGLFTRISFRKPGK